MFGTMDAPLKFVPPGGYRACASCAAAKAKCIQPEEGEGKCERCQRLDKDCQIIRRAKKRRRQTEQNAAGGAKLDDGIDAAVMTHRAPLSGPAGPPDPAPSAGPTYTSAPSPEFVFNIAEPEAEALLRLFRDHLNPLNPFVEIRPSITAAELRAEKPMVFLGVMFAASYHDFELQKNMARSIMTYISEQQFQQGRRSLQLLQGAILFLYWYSTQLFANPQVVNLLHIIMALTTDLGLDKLESRKLAVQSPLAPFADKSLHGPAGSPDAHNMEERRALAASFYLTSTVSSNVHILTALGYSHQIEKSCEIFEQGDVGGPDHRLAKLVRLQYIISRIYNAQKETDLPGGPTFPISFYMKSLQNDLEHFWDTLPAELREDITLRLLYHTGEIHLYKMSLVDNEAPSSPNHHVEHPEEMHVNCLIALKSWFDLFFSIPTASYFHVPIPIFVQLAHADVTLAKLTAFWRGRRPPSAPPDFPPFEVMMERIACKFDEAKLAAHPLGKEIRNGVFDQYAARLRSYKQLDFSRPSAAALAAAAAAAAAAGGGVDTPDGTPSGTGSLSVQPSASTPPTDLTSQSSATMESEAASVAGGHVPMETTATTSEEVTPGDDWAEWYDGCQTTWIHGDPEPVTWQSSYDVWSSHSMQGVPQPQQPPPPPRPPGPPAF